MDLQNIDREENTSCQETCKDWQYFSLITKKYILSLKNTEDLREKA